MTQHKKLTPTQTIQNWIKDFVTRPNPVFGDLPPCPYAQKAMVEDKVKFVERVKLTRAIEKLEKANPDERRRPDAVTRELESLRDDLHYVTNFPKGYKYVSVLKGDAEDDAIKRKREKLRIIIKERGLADAALAEANEGGTDVAAAAAAKKDDGKEKDDFFMESDSDSDSDSD